MKHVSFWNDVIPAAILRGPVQYIKLMIVGMLRMIDMKVNNCAAIVNKESSQMISLAAIFEGQTSGSRNNRMFDPVWI